MPASSGSLASGSSFETVQKLTIHVREGRHFVHLGQQADVAEALVFTVALSPRPDESDLESRKWHSELLRVPSLSRVNSLLFDRPGSRRNQLHWTYTSEELRLLRSRGCAVRLECILVRAAPSDMSSLTAEKALESVKAQRSLLGHIVLDLKTARLNARNRRTDAYWQRLRGARRCDATGQYPEVKLAYFMKSCSRFVPAEERQQRVLASRNKTASRPFKQARKKEAKAEPDSGPKRSPQEAEQQSTDARYIDTGDSSPSLPTTPPKQVHVPTLPEAPAPMPVRMPRWRLSCDLRSLRVLSIPPPLSNETVQVVYTHAHSVFQQTQVRTAPVSVSLNEETLLQSAVCVRECVAPAQALGSLPPLHLTLLVEQVPVASAMVPLDSIVNAPHFLDEFVPLRESALSQAIAFVRLQMALQQMDTDIGIYEQGQQQLQLLQQFQQPRREEEKEDEEEETEKEEEEETEKDEEEETEEDDTVSENVQSDAYSVDASVYMHADTDRDKGNLAFDAHKQSCSPHELQQRQLLRLRQWEFDFKTAAQVRAHALEKKRLRQLEELWAKQWQSLQKQLQQRREQCVVLERKLRAALADAEAKQAQAKSKLSAVAQLQQETQRERKRWQDSCAARLQTAKNAAEASSEQARRRKEEARREAQQAREQQRQAENKVIQLETALQKMRKSRESDDAVILRRENEALKDEVDRLKSENETRKATEKQLRAQLNKALDHAMRTRAQLAETSRQNADLQTSKRLQIAHAGIHRDRSELVQIREELRCLLQAEGARNAMQPLSNASAQRYESKTGDNTDLESPLVQSARHVLETLRNEEMELLKLIHHPSQESGAVWQEKRQLLNAIRAQITELEATIPVSAPLVATELKAQATAGQPVVDRTGTLC
ncbi:MAG: hypothetical protein MHM6MM_002595 [Cercozoa sp. M6MM]